MTIENYQLLLKEYDGNGNFPRLMLLSGQQLLIKTTEATGMSYHFAGMNVSALGVQTRFNIGARLGVDDERVLYECPGGRTHGYLNVIQSGIGKATVGLTVTEGTVGEEFTFDEWQLHSENDYLYNNVLIPDIHLLAGQSLWISEQGAADVTWIVSGLLIDDSTGELTPVNLGVVASTTSSAGGKTIYTCPAGKSAILNIHVANWSGISPNYRVGVTCDYCTGGNYVEEGGGET